MRFFFALLALSTALAAADISPRKLSLILDPRLGAPARHGIAVLTDALQAHGWAVEVARDPDSAAGTRLVLASLAAIPDAVRTRKEPRQELDWPEALSVKKFVWKGKPSLALVGADDRGLMYAALDTAERVAWSADPSDPFSQVQDHHERPFVQDRTLSIYTMNRAYWESRFYDQRYWTRYLDLLAASRFDRLLIIFGYENGGFLAPPYPYFFATPGFPDVHMVDLTPAQQARNLTALNRLIELAHARGIAVSLGIWDHIYRAGVQTGGAEWIASYQGKPIPNTVEGVTTSNLNAYKLASLRELLRRLPKIDGLQFRIHEESGLKREEMDGFWRDVFTEMHQVRPDLLIEARAKGTPDSVIATAVSLGVKLRVETKYWMEQMGLPYHPTHVNPPDQHNRRHGYADLLRYPQHYQIDWRLWNGGTTRVLLWGDPEYVRRYSESTQLYDSPNWDVQEPLATKMEAQRPDMTPFELMPAKYRYFDYEFERYWHFYQLWGRLGYNPHTPDDFWRHEFTRRFDAAGSDLADALHRASEVLPMIVAAVYPYRLFPTTRGWAERQSLGVKLEDYATNEGTDTEIFESFAEAAQRILSHGATAKRTPVETSHLFDATADAILASVARAERANASRRTPEFESTVIDVKLLAQLARFHARRCLAAVHYNLYKTTRNRAEFAAAVADERAAVAEWKKLVAIAGDHYAFDLAMGARNYDLCGHWRDELAGLEVNLARLEQDTSVGSATDEPPAWYPPERDIPGPQITHDRILRATPGQSLRISARVSSPHGIKSVRVCYRHVSQFEDYRTVALLPGNSPDLYVATLPADAVSPEWDFMYFLEAIDDEGHGTHWPDPMREMPYVIVPVDHATN